jgi:hypothetical protein
MSREQSTQATDQTVFVVTKGNGNVGADTYHTDRACPHLKKADRVTEKAKAQLADRRTECDRCAGEVDKCGYDDSLYRAALAADVSP